MIDVAEVLYVNTVKYVTLHLIVTACWIQKPFCGLDSLRVSWLAVQNWRILLEQSVTDCRPMLAATSAFRHILKFSTVYIMSSPHTRLTAPCPGLPRWAGTRKVKPIWILLKQETVSGSGISWAICKSAHRSRQITTPAPHRSVFYRPDALPAAQPTASKHWRQWHCFEIKHE